MRPTSDQVREAMFNILGPLVEGAKVLDLFAGTGALACEALSRGAALAVLVEDQPAALEWCDAISRPWASGSGPGCCPSR